MKISPSHLRLQAVRKEEIKPRVLELIQLVGLSGKEDNYPSQLSGGQKTTRWDCTCIG